MLKSHTHIGCNVSEIQNQKDEHQAFQDTAKVSELCIFLRGCRCYKNCNFSLKI